MLALCLMLSDTYMYYAKNYADIISLGQGFASDSCNNKDILGLVNFCKRQKLSERRVLRFTRFHQNVGKTFVVSTSTVWKVLKKVIVQLNIQQKKFCGSSKIREKHETFLLLKLLSFTV